MRQTLIYFIGVILVCVSLSSCRDTPLIGDLAGQWQIQTIEWPDSTVKSDHRHFYCFYRHTAQLTETDKWPHTANMTYEGDHITLAFPGSSSIWLTAWGITSTGNPDEECVVNYTVKKLNGNNLVLVTEQGTVINMIKY